MNTMLKRIPVFLFALFCAVSPIRAQGGDDPLMTTAQAIERVVSQNGDSTILAFADQYFTPAYRASLSDSDLIAMMEKIRTAAHDFGGVGLDSPAPGQGRMFLETADRQVTVEFDLEPGTNKLSRLELISVEELESIDPITWENFQARLKQEEAGGFAGAILIARGDSIILEQGYGMADRENKIPNSANTIFAIGSTPIDFTNAALLKLEETGRLSLNDPIAKYLTDVPKDKIEITIQHLRTGESGLPDFHDTEADDDPDLSWIDRRTAINRILSQPLLFRPGDGNRHSHSAWVLLTAIVEIVAEQEYHEFLQEQFFDRAGMTRTGSYTFSQQFDDSEVAIGYGRTRPIDPNSPQHWGKTSWLVKGSGGMVSTVGDLWRWHVAMKSGKLLGAEAMKKYPLYSAGVGGNMRGFLNCFDYEPDAGYILCSNSHEAMDDRAFQISRALERMVVGD